MQQVAQKLIGIGLPFRAIILPTQTEGYLNGTTIIPKSEVTVLRLSISGNGLSLRFFDNELIFEDGSVFKKGERLILSGNSFDIESQVSEDTFEGWLHSSGWTEDKRVKTISIARIMIPALSDTKPKGSFA